MGGRLQGVGTDGRGPAVQLVPKDHLRRKSALVGRFFAAPLEESTSTEVDSEADTTEFQFLSSFKDELCRGDVPFLEAIPSDAYDAESIHSLRDKQAVPVRGRSHVQTVVGPLVDHGNDQEEPQTIDSVACGLTVSTYPRRNERLRDGDPICDRFGISVFRNRAIVVVADGCNWGSRPRQAAIAARDSVLSYLTKKQGSINSVGDAQLFLLRAFNEAQRSVCADTVNVCSPYLGHVAESLCLPGDSLNPEAPLYWLESPWRL